MYEENAFFIHAYIYVRCFVYENGPGGAPFFILTCQTFKDIDLGSKGFTYQSLNV